MMPSENGSFRDLLGQSSEPEVNRAVVEILTALFPDAHAVRRASDANDRLGVDFWVELTGRHIGVDIKERGVDFQTRGHDDLALETWSVVEHCKVGWTRDPSKRCDFVLWYWKDTGRYHLLPFQPLCAVFVENWEIWREQYQVATQHTSDRGDYHSECVYVPRTVVWRAIWEHADGR